MRCALDAACRCAACHNVNGWQVSVGGRRMDAGAAWVWCLRLHEPAPIQDWHASLVTVAGVQWDVRSFRVQVSPCSCGRVMNLPTRAVDIADYWPQEQRCDWRCTPSRSQTQPSCVELIRHPGVSGPSFICMRALTDYKLGIEGHDIVTLLQSITGPHGSEFPFPGHLTYFETLNRTKRRQTYMVCRISKTVCMTESK